MRESYFDSALIQIAAKADLIAREIDISDILRGENLRDALRLTDEIDIKIHELRQYKEDELTADVMIDAMTQIISMGETLGLVFALFVESRVSRNDEQQAAAQRMLTEASGIIALALIIQRETVKLEVTSLITNSLRYDETILQGTQQRDDILDFAETQIMTEE